MLRHGSSFVALNIAEFEAEHKAQGDHTAHAHVVIRGCIDAGALPVQYDGHCVSAGHPEPSLDQEDLAITTVIKLAGTLADGPELLRHVQRPTYAQFLAFADMSLELPEKFASVERVGRTCATTAATRTPGAVFKNANAIIPEVSWVTSGAASEVMVAQGLGTTKDAGTGVFIE
jgi:hypothetical protein